MKRTNIVITLLALVIIAIASYFVLFSASNQPQSPLTVAISPYQDLAMLMTYEHLGLETKYDVRIDVKTLQWEDIIPSLASAGRTIDVGFGSLIEFLTKYENINADTDDPLVFVFPAYVFKGGGFVSFNPRVPNLDDDVPPKADLVREFFSYRLGAQKNSMFDMLLFSLANGAGLEKDSLRITDTTMADGILAAQAGSLDAVAAGLTQRNEAIERGGRIVLTMDKFGFADLTGLICRRSTLESRRKEIEALIKMWFDCVDYVYTDLDKHSTIPIAYLNRTSSTQYSVETYKRALEAEYLPRSLREAQSEMVMVDGRFSIHRISRHVSDYLVNHKIVQSAPPLPEPIVIQK